MLGASPGPGQPHLGWVVPDISGEDPQKATVLGPAGHWTVQAAAVA